MRFVHPARFGIFSTPVIDLLHVTRPATVDLYLAYCDELARWGQHFGLPSVAQTESALWTYAETAKFAARRLDPGHLHLGKYVRFRWGAPERDNWLDRRMIGANNRSAGRVR